MAKTEIEIDASEVDDAIDNLVRLDSNLRNDADELQRDEPYELLELIQRNIDIAFDSSSGDGSLKNLFKTQSTQYGAKITTAGLTKSNGRFDHAPRALEDGNPPHKITPNPDNESGTLKFQPEDGYELYPDSAQRPNGWIEISSVMWKPRTKPNGYKYVLNAQRAWNAEIERTLPTKISSSIMKAGYRRE